MKKKIRIKLTNKFKKHFQPSMVKILIDTLEKMGNEHKKQVEANILQKVKNKGKKK